jgi:hypothetical protein
MKLLKNIYKENKELKNINLINKLVQLYQKKLSHYIN